MASEIIREMREIVSNGTIEPNVAYRLIISGQIELHDLVTEMGESHKKVCDDLKAVEKTMDNRPWSDVGEIEKKVNDIDSTLKIIGDNPSIVWLLRHKFLKTTGIIFSILTIFHLGFEYFRPLLDKVFAFLGIF